MLFQKWPIMSGLVLSDFSPVEYSTSNWPKNDCEIFRPWKFSETWRNFEKNENSKFSEKYHVMLCKYDLGQLPWLKWPLICVILTVNTHYCIISPKISMFFQKFLLLRKKFIYFLEVYFLRIKIFEKLPVFSLQNKFSKK